MPWRCRYGGATPGPVQLPGYRLPVSIGKAPEAVKKEDQANSQNKTMITIV
jgi:hypothetical protein